MPWRIGPGKSYLIKALPSAMQQAQHITWTERAAEHARAPVGYAIEPVTTLVPWQALCEQAQLQSYARSMPASPFKRKSVDGEDGDGLTGEESSSSSLGANGTGLLEALPPAPSASSVLSSMTDGTSCMPTAPACGWLVPAVSRNHGMLLFRCPWCQI